MQIRMKCWFLLLTLIFTNGIVEATNRADKVSVRSLSSNQPVLKPSSLRTKSAILRDPFWPVGYHVATPAHKLHNFSLKEATQAEWSKALSEINIDGIIQAGDIYYAAVNGMIVQVGDVIAVAGDEKIFRFLVYSINLKRIYVKPIAE